MAHYSGKGWHFQTRRHSNARKYGRAGGTYAKTFDISTKKGIKKAENFQKNLYKKYNYVHIEPIGFDKVKLTGKKHYGSSVPNNISGGIADNINPKYFNQLELSKGIKIELEHTNNPKIAREIATDHLAENPKYYEKLEKIEGKIKPIKVKIPQTEIKKDKNKLEKDLQTEINKTKNPSEKQELEKILYELEKADTKTKFKRFIDEYGYTLSTIGLAIPFYIVSPLAVAGVLFGATITGDVPMTALVPRVAVPLTATIIGTEAVRHSIRTIRAIKKREKEIIKEKTQELQDNTTLPKKEINIIAKRIAQQELAVTPLAHELV